MDQTNSKLPRGWALSRLEEIAMLNPRHPSDLDSSIDVSFVPMPDVDENGWKLKLSHKRPLSEVRKGYTHFVNGDVLFAKITPCMENGKAAVAEELENGIGCGTTELTSFDLFKIFNPNFSTTLYTVRFPKSGKAKHDRHRRSTENAFEFSQRIRNPGSASYRADPYRRQAGKTPGKSRRHAQENPDYLEAVNHLKGLRARQLEALGWDRASILNHVQNEAFQIAEAALQRGQNPAEVAFNMAVASGWAKKEQQNQQEQKIETLQKGMQAAKSLGSGGNPSGKLTVDAIANMDAQEFDEFVRNGGWEKLIG